MNLDRRGFLRFSALLAGAAAGVRLSVAAQPFRERLFLYQEHEEGIFGVYPGRAPAVSGGNSMVIAGKGEAAIVDSKFAPVAPALRRECEELAGPITRLINTHHHGDHTGGNAAFKGCEVVAHANASERIKGQLENYRRGIDGIATELARHDFEGARQALEEARRVREQAAALTAADFAPTRTIESDTEFDVGGIKVVLRYLGPGHTDNDLVVYVPSKNVLHAGDLLFNRTHPFIDRPGGSDTRRWQQNLKAIEEMCDQFTTVVPGHGVAATRSQVAQQGRYFEDMRQLVAGWINDGRAREQITAVTHADLPEEYRHYGGERILARTLGGLYDELTSEQGASHPRITAPKR